jgi:hypothetical protein
VWGEFKSRHENLLVLDEDDFTLEKTKSDWYGSGPLEAITIKVNNQILAKLDAPQDADAFLEAVEIRKSRIARARSSKTNMNPVLKEQHVAISISVTIRKHPNSDEKI